MSRDVAGGVRVRLAVGALLAAALGHPSATAAAPTGAGEDVEPLRWRAPAGCPDEAAVRARLVHVLPPDVEAPRVEVEVARGEDGRFHATVVLRGSWGETTRRLDSPGCDTLADAVVLLAAVSPSTAAGELEPPIVAVPEPTPVEPSVEVDDRARPEDASKLDVAGGQEAEAGDLEAAPIEPSHAERSSRGAADADPAAPMLRGLARVEARAGAGLLPVVDLGAAATLGLEHRWFRVELGGAAWLPRERTVAPDARVRASAWAVELRGCAALRPTAWLVVLPCAELEAGRLRGEGLGDGLVNGRIARQPWVAIGLGPAVSFRLHRLVGLWVGATAVVPVRRVGLGLDGLPTDAHRVATVAGRGAVGVEIHFQ